MSFEKFTGVSDFDFELNKKKFIENLEYLKHMSVEESTLYKKWQEFNKDVEKSRQWATVVSKQFNDLGIKL